jgi:2-polyprenyl-6-methoxyphenol hydroxylase-like FAD-dependent oxidoreductase
MTLAIELKRVGLDVRIIDKSDHPALHSQALVVQARTLEQFQRHGIATQAVDEGRKLTKVIFWSDGKQLVSFGLERIHSNYPYVLFLPQNKTEAILNEHMESLGVRIDRNAELISFTQSEGAISSILRRGDGREEQIESRWIVGCDGAHSTVRKLCSIPFEGDGVGLSFFLGDLEIDGPDAPTDFLALHLHKGDVLFMGSLSEKWTRLIVALHAKQNAESERDPTIADFQDAADRAGVRIKIHSSDWMTPFHVNDRQAEHYRSGNAFLAGDAAHIHSPVGGQGMNTGIQDAANLAWKLAAVVRGADERLLNSYETERGAVGKALLKFTERGLKMATASNPVVEHLRDMLLPVLSKPKIVQDTVLGFISETAIEYRSSPIVHDHGGDGLLRAGDRLPDLEVHQKDARSTLLADWRDGKHLAVLVNASESDRRGIGNQLGQVKLISVNSAQFSDEGRRTLGEMPKALVVRPDGYVGFRAPLDKLGELNTYARQDGLHGP